MKNILATLAILGFAAPAFAQAADFATVDADQSGTVTLEEVQAAMPDVTEDAFTAADADESGDLSEDEFATLAG
ncbi:hypothetical protein VSX64_24025 [Aurantimonas sp. C2-6-R+9]|uniref:EF-hand domain-containing protein n=1 Tax=Aurantimonas aggregata TaxID=2047720 RepID=A0A6L9MNR7_9HYPH|nr:MULTISPECIES: EF-hand domain-containing protein [Aurantimonas]MEC5293612.1 hypothetical protein [Aurantimonas sp. C2-3-R2]MEC5383800.1 hypothetical protein [Aurantimonas sp. C2-6-R+9]MEC5414684.1 hypothetical protein [Aurantimonas sp. C2-4-R8]NDV89385.1 EF-hand domain-containing protein [Aurantimonas aggregata]